MNFFSEVISISGVSYLIFSIMAIVALGYLLGRVTVKGVSLGTAGVFVVSLLYGAFFYDNLADAMKTAEIASHGLKIVENLGLVFFVTSVGFIAGPKFFKNLKNNFKSYIMLGFIIILAGGLTCVICYLIGRNFESDNKQFLAMMDGLLSGSLTTTPGFSAAKETVKNFYAATPELASGYEDAVTVGHGIAYLFGVIGVVLFVQILPKLVHADMDEERRKLASVDTGEANTIVGKLINIDDMGLGAFGLAALIGIIIGNIKIPLTAQGFSGTCFSLTTTGGALITSLLFGHFSHIGRINIMPEKKTLEVLRELGLMIFLIGAGIAGGASFIKYFRPVYFLYGALMTLVPMFVGYFIATKVLKLSLLNSLGSITGGMTSTPALGTLIHVAKTEDVAAAYAATYPIALLVVVLVSQFLIVFFG
ncbi:MAG: permease [Eubacteriales bacterium]|nr:permease [Eubacteriales bacterium]MDO5585613.1 permease [Clostridia bacterium]MDY4214491.1 permease [Eubacteriales bacterium]MDY5231479.1 permease [Eubacteriales bacterium]